MSTARNLKGTIYHNPSKGTFRFRYGRDGHCKTFQTKGEANEYQMLFTRELKQNGTTTLDTLKCSTEAKAAFTLLSQEDLPPSALVDAVSFYIANTNPSSRKTTFSKATADVMKTERFKKTG